MLVVWRADVVRVVAVQVVDAAAGVHACPGCVVDRYGRVDRRRAGGGVMARKSEAKAARPKLKDLDYLVGLPVVASFLSMAESTARAAIVERDGGFVLPVAGKELPVHRQGRRWCAWRADLAEMIGERVA